MTVPSGTLTTFGINNYVGPIFNTSITDTPATSMLGGLGAFDIVNSVEFPDHQNVSLPSAAQDTQLEGDDPTPAHRTRDDVTNVVQIHQEAVQPSYTQIAATGRVVADNADLRTDSYFLGDQPVQGEFDFQMGLKMEKVKQDLEFSFFQGSFSNPNDNNSARQTRGINSHVSTNSISAGSTDLSRDHLQELFRTMADNGARFRNLVLFGGSLQVQRFTDVYAYAPESRTIGGVAIETVLTDFGRVASKWSHEQVNSAITAVEIDSCRVTALPFPGKGVLFVEALARTGSSVKGQLYGELGFRYGPETWHGEITSLSTS